MNANQSTNAAAQRWSEGDVVRSAPRSVAPSGGAGKPTSTSMGIHARITAEVRRTTSDSAASWRYEDDGSSGGGAAVDSDGWVEVSKTKPKSKLAKSATAAPPPPSQQEYDNYEDYQSDY
jgi:hypothetical protein